MKRSILIPITALLFVGEAFAVFPECPKATDSLEEWRSKVIASVSSGNEEMAGMIRSCFPNEIPACLQRLYKYNTRSERLGRSPERTPEDEKYYRLPSEFLVKPSESSGTRLEDEVYQFFKKTGSSVQDFEAVAKNRGWPVVRYKSRHSGGFDEETPSLMMIRIPGSSLVPPVDYDRYVNIALPADQGEGQMRSADVNPIPRAPIPTAADYASNGHRNPSTVTMVTVRKAAPGRAAQVYLTKFEREGGSGFRSSPNHSVGGCYECHPNGLRAISPLGFHVREDEVARNQVMPASFWKDVQEMNNSMMVNSGFKTVDWGNIRDSRGQKHKALDPDEHGPIWGPLKPLSGGKTREKNFIVGADTKSGCAFGTPEISVRDIFGRAPGRDNVYRLSQTLPVNWQKVANAMNCASCHNDRIRGALNGSLDTSQLKFKILVDQSMPVGAHRNPLDRGAAVKTAHDDLNANERIALVSCLKAEFDLERREIGSWYKEMKCGSTTVSDLGGQGGSSLVHDGNEKSMMPPGRPTVPGPRPRSGRSTREGN